MRKPNRASVKKKMLLLRSASIVLTLLAAVVLLSQTAFAKNTYVITDGNRVITYSTYATDPARILGEAGLTLDENDSYTAQLGGSTAAITVQRSQDIQVVYYGESSHVSSYGETVSQLLTRLNIFPEDNDVVSQPLDSLTYDGMVLVIDRVICLEQTYTATVPHDVTYCYDATLPQGTQSVLIPGVDGQNLCTADVTYTNGLETRRVLTDETVLSAPVTEVVALGTGAGTGAPVDPQGLPMVENGKIILPTGEILTFTDTMQVGATAYFCNPWDRGITATGTKARVGAIAVDPEVIPYGTRMFIISNDGEYVYGIATAEDCGDPQYIGGNRVDLYFNTYDECIQFGYRQCTVYFLGSGE